MAFAGTLEQIVESFPNVRSSLLGDRAVSPYELMMSVPLEDGVISDSNPDQRVMSRRAYDTTNYLIQQDQKYQSTELPALLSWLSNSPAYKSFTDTTQKINLYRVIGAKNQPGLKDAMMAVQPDMFGTGIDVLVGPIQLKETIDRYVRAGGFDREAVEHYVIAHENEHRHTAKGMMIYLIENGLVDPKKLQSRNGSVRAKEAQKMRLYVESMTDLALYDFYSEKLQDAQVAGSKDAQLYSNLVKIAASRVGMYISGGVPIPKDVEAARTQKGYAPLARIVAQSKGQKHYVN
jgi:hypothetical protein